MKIKKKIDVEIEVISHEECYDGCKYYGKMNNSPFCHLFVGYLMYNHCRLDECIKTFEMCKK